MAFICDASELAAGDIILIEKPVDPSGRATYAHFFVVMHVPGPLKVGDRIPCIGITSRLPEEQFDPELHLKLPWLNRRGGHPSTGLSKPSVAKVAFRHSLVVEAGKDYPRQ